MEEMTGVKAEEMMGKGDYEYGIPFYGARRPILIDWIFASDEELEKKYTIIRREGDLIVAEVDLVLPDGRNVTLWGKATPLYDDKGNKAGAIESIRDVTDRKQAEDALKKSEEQLRLKLDSVLSPDVSISEQELANIIDNRTIQSMMEDFTRLTGMVTAILDINGNIIEAAGWQDICTRFHRVNKETARFCTESNLYLAKNMKPGEYVMYKCKNNMWDVVTPLYIGDKHIGNIYTGQFFFDDETIDEAVFVAQAEKYGFDREEYLSALRRVPRFSREKINYLMTYLVKFTDFISRLSYSNIKLAKIISDYKLAEIALKQSEDKYRALFENSGSPLMIFDDDTTISQVNREMEKLSGYRRDEIEGRNSWTEFIVNKEDREKMIEYHHLRKVHPDHVPATYESRIMIKNGELRDVLITVAMIPGTSQRLAALVDITGRKQSEEALRTSEERFRGIASNLPGIVYQFYARDTGEWGMYFVDGRSRDVYGLSPEPLDTWYERYASCIAPEDQQRWVESINDVVIKVAPWDFEGRFIKPTGEEMYIRGLSQPVRLQNETVWNGILLDITERRKAEEELRRLYTELEQRVAERTADLRQAQDAFRQANEKLNLLSSITRHDILNQLMALSGFLELSRMKIHDDAVGEYIRKAQHAAVTIGRHISFTKQYQDIGVKSPVWQNVRECVEKPVTDLLPVSVTCTVDLDEIEIYADPLFEKVLYTLVDNTLRHGERVTLIRFSYRMSDTGELILLYDDNGVGIRAEDKERIFERGFGKHTGFGLFLAREILAITGITIRETGTEETGARFEIAVPKGAYRFKGTT